MHIKRTRVGPCNAVSVTTCDAIGLCRCLGVTLSSCIHHWWRLSNLKQHFGRFGRLGVWAISPLRLTYSQKIQTRVRDQLCISWIGLRVLVRVRHSQRIKGMWKTWKKVVAVLTTLLPWLFPLSTSRLPVSTLTCGIRWNFLSLHSFLSNYIYQDTSPFFNLFLLLLLTSFIL